ncbi:hypothetical protein NHF46_22055 [Arthrobacter alpinus]|nr:hypothetical protein [Arthrobacter alpinus]
MKLLTSGGNVKKVDRFTQGLEDSLNTSVDTAREWAAPHVENAKDWTAPRVEAALGWAVPRIEKGIEHASPSFRMDCARLLSTRPTALRP